MSLLKIRNLQVVYPNGLEALKSVNLSAEAGEVIAIVGRSGAGKSTLLRCINGLQPVTNGSIRLEGRELTALSPRELQLMRRRIGFVWQEFNLVDRLPVITNVLCGRLGHAGPYSSLLGYFDRSHREVALRNIERVNLLERAEQRADRLSGGEKQRISIARAISQEPTLILADEPVASLDPELSWQVMADLARVVREDNLLALINIHQVTLAKHFVDRVIGIARGSVVFDGPARDFDEAAMNRVYRYDKPAIPAHPVELEEVIHER